MDWWLALLGGLVNWYLGARVGLSILILAVLALASGVNKYWCGWHGKKSRISSACIL